MSKDEDDTPLGAEASEGVRIVGPAEARAARDSGEVVSKLTSQQRSMRAPNENEESPTLSFPLPDDESLSHLALRPRVAARPVSSVISEDGADVVDLRAVERHHSDDEDELDPLSVTMEVRSEGSTASTRLPHWTEPRTGEVPVVLASDGGGGDVGGKPRWRDQHSAWSAQETSLEDLGDASGLGDQRASDEAGPFADAGMRTSGTGSSSHDQDRVPGTADGLDQADGTSASARRGARFREPSVIETAKTKLGTASFARRVGTGLAFAAVAVAAFAIGPAATLVLSSAVMLIAMVEFFDGTRRAGHRPATLLALLAVAGLMFGTYARGESAIVLVLALSTFFVFLWYLAGVIRQRPTTNIAVTMLGIVWIGVAGSFAALLLRMPDRTGMALLIGAVLCTAVYDTVAYIGGNIFGRNPLAPSMSPNKTWEGLASGTIAVFVVGASLDFLIEPWTLPSALVMAALVAVMAPIGDLVESMIKRDLGLKDMGHLLPGHGGLLDRFDALLFVLPATYYLALVLDIS